MINYSKRLTGSLSTSPPTLHWPAVMLTESELDQVSGGSVDSASLVTRGSLISAIRFFPPEPMKEFVQTIIADVPPNPIKGGGVT